ncbi:MAG: hypothetical protein FIA96_00355 [Betaproteobacteria bacterium]|nr:hypothetical protein [Betaproteobacteria bacterium]
MIRPGILLGLFFLAGLATGISAKELPCKGNSIVVHGAEPQDVQDGCEAVKSAANFFESSGLAMPKNVRILLVDGQSTPFLEVHEMGSYDSRQNAIRVLAYQPAVKATEMNEPGLGRITTRAHWRSYINHELTHAAIHTGCSKACPSRAIHEYVAAVAQIVSLPEKQRTELLKPYRDLEPFDRLSEITETYYAINPHYFAVKSYRHYQQLSDPRAFFRSVLHLAD